MHIFPPKFFRALCAPFFALVLTAPHMAAAQQIETVESKYNTIVITQDDPYISMRFGHNARLYTETVFNPGDPMELPVPYTQFMTVALTYPDTVDSVLEIGAGGGRTASYLSGTMKDDVNVITVELDAEVIRLAKKHLALQEKPNLSVVISDGRLHLLRDKTRHDVIMVDAYRGPFVPFHLLTQEFYTLISQRLNPGGVLVQNIEPSTMLFEAALVTFTSVFENVDLYVTGANIVAVAYDGTAKTDAQLRDVAARLDQRHSPRHPMLPMIDGRKTVDPALITGKILRDDFAPVQYLRSIKRHNQRIDDILK